IIRSEVACTRELWNPRYAVKAATGIGPLAERSRRRLLRWRIPPRVDSKALGSSHPALISRQEITESIHPREEAQKRRWLGFLAYENLSSPILLTPGQASR